MVSSLFLNFSRLGGPRLPAEWQDENPIRSEVFGEDRLREHATSLAQSHKLGTAAWSHRLLFHIIRDDYDILKQAHAEVLQAIAREEGVTPAAEWLADNFYSISQHARQVAEDLPTDYYRKLPKLADGHLAKFPRIMAIAWAYLAHTDSHFNAATLAEFVNAYQQVSPLTLGELWAAPIYLRILLIDNAARVARRTHVSMKARQAATALATEFVGQSDALDAARSALEGLEDHAKLSYIVQLLSAARAHHGLSMESIEALRSLYEATPFDHARGVQEEHARQTANNLTMQNIFTSLKRIAEEDWVGWVESVSEVDRRLTTSPSYRQCDSATRTIYRRAIEEMANLSHKNEGDVADAALRLAAGDDIGIALIGAKRKTLEKQLAVHKPLYEQVFDILRHTGVVGYGITIWIAAVVVIILGARAVANVPLPPAILALMLIFLLAPAVDAAVAMVNFAVTQLVRPIVLPSLSFDRGIPAEHRTIVAVPTLLTSFHGIEDLLNHMEEHFLANRDQELSFALVTDWRDASSETREDDDALLAAAADGIAALNKRHATDQFLLFHRKRLWNGADNVWMGWERKRGKLHELNRILRGATDTSFIHVPPLIPADVKYVIVLDADTILPRGIARRLVGKMAHPLNQPHIEPRLQRVDRGYGIIQPRVTISLPEIGRGSWYQRIFAVGAGVDPYVAATSDVYQDLFGEGSFTGKGIYHIDAFESVMDDRVPDNALLSHDLLEGNIARSALATDVEVVEDYPERYLTDLWRQHRWVRGDWQLLSWMVPPARSLTALGLWKMADNLRRSLTPAGTIAALALGIWVLPTASTWTWCFFILALLFFPNLLSIFAGTSFRNESTTVASQLRTLRDDTTHAILLTLARLILLANQSFYLLDAIGRTLYRMMITKRKLLEWTAAAQIQAAPKPTLGSTYHTMAVGAAAAVLIPLGRILVYGDLNVPSLFFAALWLAAPAFAYHVSLPAPDPGIATASEEQLQELRLIALRTWRYFDTHVTAEENFLPPDNVQEDPKLVVAHRTSPTNIGLYLLATIAACEAGWIGKVEAARRLNETFNTIDKLAHHRGHLLNWYDTQSLAALPPRYVSAVDSGNLAGHCIAVANALDAWGDAAALRQDNLKGLDDLLVLVSTFIADAARHHRQATAAARDIGRAIGTARGAISEIREQPELISLRIIGLIVQLRTIETSAKRLWDIAPPGDKEGAIFWLDKLVANAEGIYASSTSDAAHQGKLFASFKSLAQRCRALAYGMDFAFLVNRQRQLLSIGYRVDEEMLDENCYDLLASEASLTSFFAIAKNDVDVKHWSRLGRPVVPVAGEACLVSWSGSMFEYLMPLLVMNLREGTLFGQTMDLSVRRQQDYGKQRGTPWGISESAYAARDKGFTYQYSSFGVPGLGLKRGLAANQVVSPYSTGLAAMVDAAGAASNYRALERYGALGRFGFYEAIDFTVQRLRKGQGHELVKAYFAHHQAMTICAICNAVMEGVLRDHFHREASVRASELLLQERAPHYLPSRVTVLEGVPAAKVRMAADDDPARHVPVHGISRPVTHLLSNGNYSLMLTASGMGWSRWKGMAINRWREDPTRDADGLMLHFAVKESGAAWMIDSPAAAGAPPVVASFSPEKAEFRRTDDGVTTHIECQLSSEDDAEARIIHLANTTNEQKTLTLTSYMELALAKPESDDAHPAFSKLFIHTEYIADHQALVAMRRKRMENDQDIWVAQFLVSRNVRTAPIEYETSREAFLGRGNSFETSRVMAGGAALTSTTGDVLDPVFALRQRLTLAPHQKTVCVLWTIAAPTRENLLERVSRHRVFAVMERVQVTAWTQSRILLRHLNISSADARLYQEMASLLIYASPALRPPPEEIASGMGRQNLLWSVGVSGTKPIVLLQLDDPEHVAAVQQIFEARNFWLEMGLAVDVVVVNSQAASYNQPLGSRLQDMAAKADGARTFNPGVDPGSILLLRSDVTTPEVLRAITCAASIVLKTGAGLIEQQVAKAMAATPPARRAAARKLPKPSSRPGAAPTPPPQFFNGFGGFNAEGTEYVIQHRADEALPAPWVNVIANPQFGIQCSAEGGGYSWFKNSRERQITPWSNDAVADTPSEAFYIRDQATGVVSSPTVLPLGRRAGTFSTRHGFGYTIHEAEENGLQMTLSHTISPDEPVKLSRLAIRNLTGKPAKLRVTSYADVVLGLKRAATARYITSQLDKETGAIFFSNRFSPDFGDNVVFADLGGAATSATSDRLSLLGWRGSLAMPMAVESGTPLQGHFGGGFDPCAALSFEVEIPAGETRECTLIMGVGENADIAKTLLGKCRGETFDTVLQAQTAQWARLTNPHKIRTPEPAFDLMMNGWLLYQTISCRFWGRAGFYQASGAFGFRDQLQDSIAVAYVRPDLTRRHILLAASRQFAEGDVQHWWLQETGAGVRTHISDDTVWLAYCTCRYLQLTGDESILDEKCTWLEGAQVDPHQHDAFYVPKVSAGADTLYEHCVRALNHSLPVGAHGLPLMGTGDWNDGMNKVGEGGKGESVWLGWFLAHTLELFAEVSKRRKDEASAQRWLEHRAKLGKALDETAWDGEWYRRAFFDDGTPLGTHTAQECQIDSIAQSWAVISQAGDPERAKQAVRSAATRLVDWQDQVASLFLPPLARHEPNAGYVQSYPAGVRENGGQYTHGALWMIFALADIGTADEALKLFQLINPINHAPTAELARRYKVEPYVIVADVYGVAPHRGRGGWTWYTGAAGWAYRAGLEAILGLRRRGTQLQVAPKVPDTWDAFSVDYNYNDVSFTLQFARRKAGVLIETKPKEIDLTKVKQGQVVKITY